MVKKKLTVKIFLKILTVTLCNFIVLSNKFAVLNTCRHQAIKLLILSNVKIFVKTPLEN